MTKIFVDTNIVLDHALGRAFADEAGKIFAMSEEGKIYCYISAGALYTLAYVLEKAIKDVELVREKLLLYLTFLTPVSNLPNNFEQALRDKSFDDIEDAFQYYTALQAGCNFFVTVNIKDFLKGETEKLPVLKPDEYLKIKPDNPQTNHKKK
jgi:predicted nucleic acid-binding protein